MTTMTDSRVATEGGTRTFTLAEAVAHLSGFDGPPGEFLHELLSMQCQVAAADGAAVMRLAAKDHVEPVAVYPRLEAGEEPPGWLSQAAHAVPRALDAGETVIATLPPEDQMLGAEQDRSLILVPLKRLVNEPAAAAFFVQTSDQLVLDQCQERIELTISLLSLYRMRQAMLRREADTQVLSTALEVLAASNKHAKARPASMAFCNELATRWKAERVSLGYKSVTGKYVKVAAMSQTEHISRKMKIVQDLESTMEECLDQDLEVIHPAGPEATTITRAAAQLSQRHGPTAVYSLPLRRGGECLGVLTVERPSDNPLTLRELEGLRLTADLCTARLIDLHERDRWFGARWAHSARKAAAALVGPRHTWAKVTALALTAVTLFLCFAKGTYKVESPFVVESRVRQVITAPFDGFIETASVETGDEVVADQTVLASLDTHELRLEVGRLAAELAGFLKEAELARDEGKPIEVQIARQRAERVRAEKALIEKQIADAELRSPVSGVVLEGDLKRRVGGPVKKGDVLFVVAPLDTLRAELSVPEDRIGDISVGDRGELASASHPGVYLPFEVEKINPLAEVNEQRNVFKVRVRLLETRPWLRPGMEGVAKVDAGERHYAWIWTRAAINWLRMQLWW